MDEKHLIRKLAKSVMSTYGRVDLVSRVAIHRSGSMITLNLDSPYLARPTFSIATHDGLAEDLQTEGPVCLELRARFSEMTRVEIRAAALPDHDPKQPPPWSLAIPRLFRDVLAHAGLPVERLIPQIDRYGGWDGVPVPGRNDIEVSNIAASSGRLLGLIRLNSARSGVEIASKDDEDGHCLLTIYKMDMPETSLMNMQRKPLDRILDHPDIVTTGHRVDQARRHRSGGISKIVLTISPDPVWGDGAPENIDLGWISVRQGRRMPLA